MKKSVCLTFIFLALMILRPFDIYSEQVVYPFKSEGSIKDAKKYMSLKSFRDKKMRLEKRMNIEFSIGEYYFKEKAFRDTKVTFQSFVCKYPTGVATLLAKAYLYKMAQMVHNQEKAQEIKKEIFKSQFILLFDKFRTLDYVSSFNNEYEVRYYVDKIEIYLNGQLFIHVEP